MRASGDCAVGCGTLSWTWSDGFRRLAMTPQQVSMEVTAFLWVEKTHLPTISEDKPLGDLAEDLSDAVGTGVGDGNGDQRPVGEGDGKISTPVPTALPAVMVWKTSSLGPLASSLLGDHWKLRSSNRRTKPIDRYVAAPASGRFDPAAHAQPKMQMAARGALPQRPQAIGAAPPSCCFDSSLKGNQGLQHEAG